jgi:hypothetical protein
MKKLYSYTSAINIALAIVIWLSFGSNVFAQDQSSAPETNPEYVQILTNAPPPGFASREDYVKSFTKEEDVIKAYDAGLISKDEAMATALLIGNTQSQDFYGRAIDQYGQPVVGATVMGYLRSDTGFGITDETVEEFKTQTDAQGLFQFTGIHGARFGQKVSKEGYEMESAGYKEQAGPNTSPQDRAIFMMWKLRGAEPMVHDQVHAYIPCDGSITRFDLLSGKQNTDGDLMVKLTRDPVNIVRGKPFNWSVTFEITNGGLQEITNLYPNEAPAEGYQSEVTYNFTTNAPNWTVHFTHSLYFKSKGGQAYGRMAVNIMADFQPPPTLFRAEIYANPTNSRNLEFDYSKQIR